MKMHLSPILPLLLIAVVVSHAALPPQVYWDKMLPNTEMPKAVQERLTTDFEVSVRTVPKATSDDKIRYYAASEDLLHDDPSVALFFQENDLHLGQKMNVHFTKTTNEATFLPRKVADAIPFSSNKMTEILNQLSVEPESAEAEAMKQTVEECEKPALEGEDKYCATSLESMVDFSTSKMGTSVKAISTEVDKNDTPKQQYSIVGLRKMVGDKSVVCHDQTYAYAVFYCHALQSTRAYKLSLVGADGTKVKAVAVCHTDTAKWNPKHLAFQVLKVKPGTVPICHFLSEDNIVWVPKN